MLAARAGRAERVDAQVGWVDRDVGDRVGFGDDGHRACRRVDAALRLGIGHALHAMPARFELEFRVRALPHDADDHFPVAAQLARQLGHDFRLPAVALGVTDVHPQQVAGEQRRLVAAGARAYFQEHVAIVVGVAGQQRRLQVGFERCDPRLRCDTLLIGKVAHRRVAAHVDGSRKISLRVHVVVKFGDDGCEVRMLLGQRAITVEIARDILGAEKAVQFDQPCRELVQFRAQRRLHEGLAGKLRGTTTARGQRSVNSEVPERR